MGNGIEISSLVLAPILAAATESGNEICGLLFGTEARIDAAQSCANVAADPTIAFEIDPAALLYAHRAAREGGPQLLGCYHSHPTGTAFPSLRDASSAAGDGWLWLILARAEVTLWRAVPSGAVHGRFGPVALVVR